MTQETWEAIANKLSDQYGLKVTLQSVHAFFKRAFHRDRLRPLGFVSSPSSLVEIQTLATATADQDLDSIYEEARKAIRAEQQSRPKIIRPSRPLAFLKLLPSSKA
jgi:hypothetical protein